NFTELARAAIPRELAGRPVEIWFQDEPSIRHSKALRALEPLAHCARVGQQGTPTRIWAKRGTRPRIRRDRRFTWAKLAKGSGRRSLLEWPAEGYLFRAICPARGPRAPPGLPGRRIHGLDQQLGRISKCVSVSAIALLILDGAGWHSSPQLILPENIVLMPLPSYAPELNSVENI